MSNFAEDLFSLKERMPNSITDLARAIKNQKIPEYKRLRLVRWFLEMKARERAIPVRVTFELTPLCNLDCKMCYVHLQSREFDKQSLLPLDVWRDFASQAYLLGTRTVTLTGGECLTYPGFEDLYLYLYQSGFGISVMSNGVLMDSQRVNFFCKYKPQFIQISLYGSSEDTYETVTGSRVFNRVYQNLLNIRNAGIKLQVSITPNRYMTHDMESLIRLAESLHVPYEINCRLIRPRANTGRLSEDMTLDEYVRIYKIRSELSNNRVPIPYDPSELPMENTTGIESKGLLCGAGSSCCAITYEGNLVPCVSLSDYSVPALKLGFAEAWRQIHEYALNYPLPSECNGCVYSSICIHCQAQHQNAPRGHCDRQICERTKKLAAAGFYHYKPQQ